MSPFTHGVTGVLVGMIALEQQPLLAERVGPGPFLVLSWFAGQIPDLDCALALMGVKIKGDSPLLKHRGIGHSMWAHLFYSLFFPCLLLNVHGGHYWEAVGYFAIQIALHLIEDMFDGSAGIFYFAPFYNKPIRSVALLPDVDQEIFSLFALIKASGLFKKMLRWEVRFSEIIQAFRNREVRCLFRRVCSELLVSLPILYGIGRLAVYR